MEETKNELTIAEMVSLVKVQTKYLLKKWLILLIGMIIFIVIGYQYAAIKPAKFTAKTTFVLSSENKGSSIMGLATQFGLDVGGGGNDAFSGENIINLFTSRLLIQRALFTPLPGGETLINHYCKTSGLKDIFLNKDRTRSAFPFPKDPETLSAIQDSLVRTIYQSVLISVLNVEKPDKKTSFYEVKTTSTDELFSYYLNVNLVRITPQFYIETKTKVARQNLAMLQNEADSLRRLLSGTIASTANAVDQTFNVNPAFQIRRAPIQQGQIKTTVLTAAYGEVVKNLEIAKLTLDREMPLYQVIDEATQPLIKQKPSKKLYAIIGGLAGLLIIATFLLIFKSRKS
jgi:LPS O-antigen subunit length determinant protein (WzzB/FepE family)